MTTLRDVTEEIARFEAALAAVPEQGRDLDPRLRQAMIDGLDSQLAELRAEQGALMVGAIVAIGVEEASRPDRPRAPKPPLGKLP